MPSTKIPQGQYPSVNLPKDIRDLSYGEMVSYFAAQGEKPFRATQVFDWIYKKGAAAFDVMTNISSAVRGQLKNDFCFEKQNLIEKLVSCDQTTKFLFSLCDHQKVESVLIPTETRATACISTQAGCKFGCKFCASGIGGWKRNLTCAEIISQVLYVKQHNPRHELSHIVFMGVGEPLDNYDHVVKAIRIINSPYGIHIAARRITISTCGLIPQIKKLAQEGIQVELAVSLHGSNNQNRNILMPVNRKYPLTELVRTCREYIKETNRQVTFEYILIRGVTCTPEAAEELGNLFKKMTCKLNLIPYNPVSEFPHETPTKTEMLLFKKRLTDLGVPATIRMPRGRDVNAACGQLRHNSTSSFLKSTIFRAGKVLY